MQFDVGWERPTRHRVARPAMGFENSKELIMTEWVLTVLAVAAVMWLATSGYDVWR